MILTYEKDEKKKKKRNCTINFRDTVPVQVIRKRERNPGFITVFVIIALVADLVGEIAVEVR